MRRPQAFFRIVAMLFGLGFIAASCGKEPSSGSPGDAGSGGASGSGGAGTGGSDAAGTGGSDAAPDASRACSDKNPTCPSSQVCDLDQPGRCAASTAGGNCITKPTACPKLYAPVCGCDGKTYGNDCERQSAGAQLDHSGACTASGCGPGGMYVSPCCGGAPPMLDAAPCTPPPPFCAAASSCTTQGNMTCCSGDAGSFCCGFIDKGRLSCLCA